MHSIAPRIVQSKGRSHSFHQLVFVVVVGGLIEHRPACSQTGLLTAGLVTEGLLRIGHFRLRHR